MNQQPLLIEASDAAVGNARISHPLAKRRIESVAMLLTDLIAINLSPIAAIPLALMVKTALEIPPYQLPQDMLSSHLIITAVSSLVIAFWFRFRAHYRLRLSYGREIKDVLAACLTSLLAAGFFFFAAKDDTSRLLVVLTWACAIIFLLGGRYIIRLINPVKKGDLKRATVIGSLSRQGELSKWMDRHKGLGIRIGEFIPLEGIANELKDSSNAALPNYFLLGESPHPQEILIAPSAEEHRFGLEAARYLTRMGIPYAFLPDLSALPMESTDIHSFSPDDVIAVVTRSNLDRPFARLTKRASDILLSAAALIFLTPLLLVIAAMVKADGGPVLFGHRRIGQAGRPFNCLKFRTMAVDAEQRLAEILESDPAAASEWRATQKLTKDPRITGIGNWLRKTSIDELPQLLNVVRGEMSLVGPRPVIPIELNRYGDERSHYLRVRPGLTGLWQVNGRNATTYEERVRLDAFYVRNWTLWGDFAVMLKTIPEVLFQGGK